MRLKDTPDLIQEFLDVSRSSSEDFPQPVPSSIPVAMVTSSSPSSSSSSMSLSVLRSSSPMISSSSIVSISSILICPSSSSSSSPLLAFPSVQPSSSSSSPTNLFQDSRMFSSSPRLASSSSSSSSPSITYSSSLSSSSFVPSFAMLKSPQKSQYVMRGCVTSKTASKCLFGPSDSQQNKIDCDNILKSSSRRNIDLMNDDSKPGLDPNKSIRVTTPDTNCEQTPAIKKRRTEGLADGSQSRRTASDTDDGTVWRSPKKFGNNLIRLIPKVTPLRRDGYKSIGADTSGHPSNIFAVCNPDHANPDLMIGPEISFGIDSSTQSTDQCNIQETLPRKVLVVQLKPVPPFKLRRVSQSNPNSKQSNSDTDFGGDIRRSNSFCQLCSSLERISTHDLNNNNNNNNSFNNNNNIFNDNFKTKSSAVRKLSFPSSFSKTPPCSVTSTQETDSTGHLYESMIISQDSEVRATISPDSSVEDSWLQDDPYLRLIRERENLGFVPINISDSKDETSGSLDE